VFVPRAKPKLEAFVRFFSLLFCQLCHFTFLAVGSVLISALLFLFMFSTFLWSPVILPVSERIHVVAVDRRLLSEGCLCGRLLQAVIFGDPIALNVRRRTEISAHQDAPFCRRCSADWTLEIERRIIVGHASLLPLFGQPMMSNSEHCTPAKRP
jgi:hypothetical protein